mgnify:CR=1 FL=1
MEDKYPQNWVWNRLYLIAIVNLLEQLTFHFLVSKRRINILRSQSQTLRTGAFNEANYHINNR